MRVIYYSYVYKLIGIPFNSLLTDVCKGTSGVFSWRTHRQILIALFSCAPFFDEEKVRYFWGGNTFWRKVLEKDKMHHVESLNTDFCLVLFVWLSIVVSFSQRNKKQEGKVKIIGTFQNTTARPIIIITELNIIPKMKA